jgi:hypothetical protein
MQRVYGSLNEDELQQLDAIVLREGSNRSKVLHDAFLAYLQPKDADTSNQLASLRNALDEQSREITHLRQLVKLQESEILHLRGMETLLASKVIPALPVASTTPIQNEPEPVQVKTPLWKKMKFWTWV